MRVLDFEGYRLLGPLSERIDEWIRQAAPELSNRQRGVVAIAFDRDSLLVLVTAVSRITGRESTHLRSSAGFPFALVG